MCTLLHVVFKTHSLLPTWNNFVDALRSNTVGEVRLATDLEPKYCSTQGTSVAATHHHALPPPSQAHARKTPLPNSTVTHKHPPVFASPYPVPPQPHPSHSLPWSAPNDYPQPTKYPLSTQFLPQPPSEADNISATLPAYSQLSYVIPSPTPSRFIPPTPLPVQHPSDAVQSIAVPQCPVQPGVAAGM